MILILLIVVAGMAFGLFNQGGAPAAVNDVAGDVAGDVFEPVATQPAAQPTLQMLAPTVTPRPAAAQAGAQAGTPGQTWTVLLYQDADDKVLEKDIVVHLNESELVWSTECCNV